MCSRCNAPKCGHKAYLLTFNEVASCLLPDSQLRWNFKPLLSQDKRAVPPPLLGLGAVSKRHTSTNFTLIFHRYSENSVYWVPGG